MKHRRGTSLAELLLIMSACTVVLTLSAELIHRVMTVQSKATALFGAERSARRLSIDFRRDLHEATGRLPLDDEATEGRSLIRLTIPSNATVEYRQNAATIERILLENGELKARERYEFPDTVDVTLSDASEETVVLTLTTPIQAPSPEDPRPKSQAYIAPANLEVVAVLGRNNRLQSGNQAAEETP